MLPTVLAGVGSLLVRSHLPRAHLHVRATASCCAVPTISEPAVQPDGPHSGGGGSPSGHRRVRLPSTQRRDGSRRSPSKKQRILALFRRAQQAISNDDLPEARQLLHGCLEIDRADAHSWLALARLEARAGDAGLARTLFVRGRRACPGNVRLTHAQAVLEGRLGMHGRHCMCKQ